MTRRQVPAPRESHNLPLILGGAITALALLLAAFGPLLAPHDPLQSLGLIRVDGVAYGPPPLSKSVPPFRLSTAPLGTDELNRDVLSRLLWAVRPTLVLCAAVVAVRLVTGTLAGLIAGWWGGVPARAINAMMRLSVAIPLLPLAVTVLLIVGVGRGLAAFIFALCLTGWIETAALVQTRAAQIRSAAYIESARAIGQHRRGILLRHVLPQIVPLLPVLLAFELAAVLLLVAEMGYLGYFIGGGFLYVYSVGNMDIQFLRRAGTPELGQMLSGFFAQLYRTPWVSLWAGAVVFVMLAGFALLGEGLRRRVDVTLPRGRRLWWRRGTAQRRAAGRAPRRRWAGAALVAAVVLAGGAALWYRGSVSRAPGAALASPAAAHIAPISTTPISVAQIDSLDLSGLVEELGGAPATYSIGRISDRPPYLFTDLPDSTRVLRIALERGSVSSGTIAVLLFPTIAERNNAYDGALRVKTDPAAIRRTQSFDPPTPAPPQPVQGLGEQSFVIQSGIFSYSGDVVFARCAALALVSLEGRPGEPLAESAVSYARRLDSFLGPRVCAD